MNLFRHSSVPMTCQEFVELVTDYFEGQLSTEDVRRFESHIGDCGLCGTYLEQMRVTIRTVGRIDEDELSPEAKAALLDAFRDWQA